MAVKVIVRDGETIAEAIKRFRELVRRFGPPGTDVKRPKWHKNQLEYYLKPCDRRRRDKLRDDFKQNCSECSKRHLVCVIDRGAKRRKAHFGNLPIVDPEL